MKACDLLRESGAENQENAKKYTGAVNAGAKARRARIQQISALFFAMNSTSALAKPLQEGKKSGAENQESAKKYTGAVNASAKAGRAHIHYTNVQYHYYPLHYSTVQYTTVHYTTVRYH
eukprot:gene24181-9771_t